MINSSFANSNQHRSNAMNTSSFATRFAHRSCFTYLTTLDLSHNYISEEEELLPAVLLTRLTRLLVFGNPLCGPTGEDETGECVDRVIDASVEARDGWGDHELDIITVGRTRAVGRKKNNLYRDLQMR